MKKPLSLLLAVLMICTSVCVFPAAIAEGIGTVYYIDPVNGDDTAAGTSEAEPWKTLSAASAKTYAPGDQILLMAGSVFNETFTALGSGTADDPILFGTYGDTAALGKPIIRSDEEEAVLLTLHDVAGWTVENIEFTAPNGSGIYITSDYHSTASDITVRDCTFHDIWNKQCSNHNGSHCPIYIKSTGQYARICNIRVADCEMYDCAFGIKTGGLNREMNSDHFVNPEESYNRDYLFEGISMNNILYDAIMLCSVNGMTIRNCSLINTSIRDDYYFAPLWSHHVCNYTVENCEIAGATNEKDGMAIDFDGWTTDATCQYIYSHDNVRFINSVCCDNYTKNSNCTVRNCLSVNDNKQPNRMANILAVAAVDYAPDEYPVAMDNFKFYNNTMINCSDIYCSGLTNSVIANNIFVGKDAFTSMQNMRKSTVNGKTFISKFGGVMTNNCFRSMGMPNIVKNYYLCDPGFTGTDTSDKNSYMLTEKSGLLGKGIQVEENMGAYDFYGNALTDKHNIGCYDGAGVEIQEKEAVCLISVYHRNSVAIASSVLSTVIGRISSVLNAYWPF